jgi:hypothetical protein
MQLLQKVIKYFSVELISSKYCYTPLRPDQAELQTNQTGSHY